MITKIAAYKSSDGTAHSTLEEAQRYEIESIFETHPSPDKGRGEWDREEIAKRILESSGHVIDILTMKPNSLPRARSVNGGTKKRKPKHIAAQNTLPLDTTEPPRAA